jgi:hypothetical protein
MCTDLCTTYTILHKNLSIWGVGTHGVPKDIEGGLYLPPLKPLHEAWESCYAIFTQPGAFVFGLFFINIIMLTVHIYDV